MTASPDPAALLAWLADPSEEALLAVFGEDEEAVAVFLARVWGER